MGNKFHGDVSIWNTDDMVSREDVIAEITEITDTVELAFNIDPKKRIYFRFKLEDLVRAVMEGK